LKAHELQTGQSARIKSIAESSISKKLMEMGCIPGTPIELEFRSPGGDPIAFKIDGYVLGLRVSEASSIDVEADPID
jgi:ferrous iron transport protein A